MKKTVKLAGITEMAKHAGVSRNAVVNWRMRFTDFPQPIARLAMGPVYRFKDFKRWFERRMRP